MRKVMIFGNSGSGKSTLAKQLSLSESLAHLDLDTLAWQDVSPPVRKPIEESWEALAPFLAANSCWVIEGCYADLLTLLLPECNEMIFLNLPVDDCIHNARQRPWEPHKYSSKDAQDANLSMLIEWIRQYPARADSCSLSAHTALFQRYTGKKIMYTDNAR